MGCLNAVFGALLPRFALLVGWYNDQTYWNALFGSQIWLALGFLVLPWTTLIYGFGAANGSMSLLNWIFLAIAFVGDLATWGIGALAGRKDAGSYYRGT